MSKLKLSTIVNQVILQFVKMGPEKWIKGITARDAKGCSISPLSKKACYFCNEGVVMKVIRGGRDNKTFRELDDMFNKETGGSGMVSFNDRYTVTFGENLTMWFKIREALKQMGK